MTKKLTIVIAILMVLALVLSACAKTASPAATGSKLKVFAAFATPIDEPWDAVIKEALEKAQTDGKITFTFTDQLGYSGDMERVIREIAEKEKPNLIIGDAFGNEEAVRRVAVDYPEIAFAFGSGGGPVEPNFSVFDNWIQEPGYLMGMYAGGLSKANKIGIVGPYPVPEATRVINAFIAGAKSVNPDAKFMISWINSWFDLAAAKEAAQAHIDNGADIIYGYPAGTIEAAAAAKLYTFGMMKDQNADAPDYVVTSAIWNMTPTVDFLVKQIAGGTYTAMDLKDFSMFAKGGATIAPLYGLESKVPADLQKMVADKEAAIKSGAFRVDIDEHVPTSD
jgi:basic membrane protein A and related proteins